MKGMYTRILQECGIRNYPMRFPKNLRRIPDKLQLLPFIGLSILGLMAPSHLFITYKDYAEHGPSIIHRRCP